MNRNRHSKQRRLLHPISAWLEGIAVSAGLTLAPMSSGWAQAQETLSLAGSIQSDVDADQEQPLEEGLPPDDHCPPQGVYAFDHAPRLFDPVGITPNFFGSFSGRATQVCQNTPTTLPLVYTGVGAEGGGSFVVAPTTVNGPSGPFILFSNFGYSNLGYGVVMLPENTELTTSVQAAFPGATFASGDGTRAIGSGTIDFAFNYLVTSNTLVCINLPNPAGGGLVGRNQYFDYGSALARDRCFFAFDEFQNLEGMGSSFDASRCVFGMERVLSEELASLELRIPFAATVNSDQWQGQALAADSTEFGNVGIAVKLILLQSSNFVLSGGLGISMPTADDSRLMNGGATVLSIENQAWLLQPLLALAYSPSERLYTQFAAQFDFDPSGNPVKLSNGMGGANWVGTIQDQSYCFVNAAWGYWLTQNTSHSGVRGLAAQCDLHYDTTLNPPDSVQVGATSIADLYRDFYQLSIVPGLHYRHHNGTAGIGVSLPLDGNASYDWGLTLQVNHFLGGQR